MSRLSLGLNSRLVPFLDGGQLFYLLFLNLSVLFGFEILIWGLLVFGGDLGRRTSGLLYGCAYLSIFDD